MLGGKSNGGVVINPNVGPVDRAIRIVIGLVLIAFATRWNIPYTGWSFADTGWNWVGWIGLIPILTALVGFCPLYAMLGVSTCPMHRAR